MCVAKWMVDNDIYLIAFSCFEYVLIQIRFKIQTIYVALPQWQLNISKKYSSIFWLKAVCMAKWMVDDDIYLIAFSCFEYVLIQIWYQNTNNTMWQLNISRNILEYLGLKLCVWQSEWWIMIFILLLSPVLNMSSYKYDIKIQTISVAIEYF